MTALALSFTELKIILRAVFIQADRPLNETDPRNLAVIPEIEEQPYLNGYRFQWSFLHPRHWLAWLGIGLYWLVGRLPFPLLVRLGYLLGDLLRAVWKGRVHVARRNLELCFPEKSAAERAQLLKDCFRNLGVAALEPGLCWWASTRRIDRLVRWQGLEHVQAQLARGTGVLACTMHFASLEMMIRTGGQKLDVVPMYRVQDNPIFEYVSGIRRRRFVHRFIPRKRVRDFLYFLRRGSVGVMLPDQDLGRKRSIFVPFFGVQAATVPTVSDFARQTRVPVVMVDIHREGTSGYVVRVSPLLENFPSDDLAADTIRINQLIEERVREFPEQYLWIHRRFKHRPDGEPKLY